jgi:hypothetical protein
MLAFGYVFGISPLRSERLAAYIQRFQPFFIWLGLTILLFFCLAFLVAGPRYWFRAVNGLSDNSRVQRAWQWLNSYQAGIVFLIISLLIGLTKLYFGRFVDEADNLNVGWLISKGYILYRDVFSHHFPFTYYWVALVAAFVGNSFAIMRISVLLLQIGLFAIAMKATNFFLTIGLTSLAWNLINQFHRGHEVLYQTLNGLFLVVSFIVIFGFMVKKSKPGYLTLALVGLLLGLALLTDPLSIYPVTIAILGIFASGAAYHSSPRWGEGLRRMLLVGASIGLVLSVFLVSLLATGTVKDFYRDTIWFNAEVYSKYVPADPIQVDSFIHNVASGLDILNPKWVENTSPFISLEPFRSDRLEDEGLYFSWIFSSFLFRLSILACSLGLILNRKFLAAIFLFLFSATLLLRNDIYFYVIGFTLLSLFAGFYFLIHLTKPVLFHIAPALSNESKSGRLIFAKRSLWTIWLALLIVVAGMYSWAAFRGAYFLAYHVNIVKDEAEYKVYERIGSQIRNLACEQENVELVAFERHPIIYFASGLLPATKYTYMNPWVAEIGQQEIIAVLRQKSFVVVWLNREKKSDTPYGLTTYLTDLIRFMEESYVYLGDDFWISPNLAAQCSAK